jgi:hypothetical protein
MAKALDGNDFLLRVNIDATACEQKHMKASISS